MEKWLAGREELYILENSTEIPEEVGPAETKKCTQSVIEGKMEGTPIKLTKLFTFDFCAHDIKQANLA